MLTLAIESSCDETSLALLETDSLSTFTDCIGTTKVLSSIISSQIEIHAQYGGVVPEIGARQHANSIHFLFRKLLKDYFQSDIDNKQFTDQEIQIILKISSIFVTSNPGLASSLRVGMEFAKSLSFFIENLHSHQKRVSIHYQDHLRGHVASCFYQKQLPSDVFPHLHLLVSGGNSQIIYLQSWQDWEIVGQTLDDAAGECLDKIGRMLGLAYPGGALISKIAKMDNQNYLNFPIGMIKSDSINFSFSGLKTAVKYFLQDHSYNLEKPLQKEVIEELVSTSNSDALPPEQAFRYQVCASAQTVVIAQLVRQFHKSIQRYLVKSIGLSGGVSANPLLRSKMTDLAGSSNLNLLLSPGELTGDNAIMIGLAGLFDRIYE